MTDQLIVLDKITAVELFDASTGKMEALLTELKTAALAEVMDGSTPEGRLHCTRHKNKVVTAQKAFDELKKSQTKHLKDEAKRIDSMGKKANDLCEELKTAIMKPRVDWEAKEALRVQSHKDAIQYIQETGFPNVLINSPLHELLETYEDASTKLEAVEVGKGYEEFEEEAKAVLAEALKNVSTNIAAITDRIEKNERLAELEAKEAKRIDDEAAEALRLEGEERAKVKLEDEAERLKAIRESEKAMNSDPVPTEDRKILSEEPKVETPPHILDPISGEVEKALTQPQNPNHKRDVNRSIVASLVEKGGITETQAQAIVTAVYYGEIEHLTIQY